MAYQIKKWVPSRFNAYSTADSGDLILYNSYTGAIVSVPPAEKEEALAALKRTGVSGNPSKTALQMIESGFLVPDQLDEKLRAKYLHQTQHRTDLLHLIILPTEACNFRCTYCYQTFPQGGMTAGIQTGIRRLAEEKSRFLNGLSVSWFGGEPLLASDMIGNLSNTFLNLSQKYGFHYSADISTNGYLMTEDLFKRLLNWEIRRYMITIDGPEAVHDKRRALCGGGNTFSRILSNLEKIKQVDGDFEIHLRVNIDMDNLDSVPELLGLLKDRFAGDTRFQLFIRPVGRWGGLNDERLPVCDRKLAEHSIWEFSRLGLEQGLPLASVIEDALLPGCSVCYAAKPHSLVIGANGKLYKCTCALDEEINQIGSLSENGSLLLDHDKLAVWVSSGDDADPVCGNCFFRPACQGNHCPLYRMKTGLRPCPHEKRHIRKVLDLIRHTYTLTGR
ncbi:radical SAM/SPASM domain-containing protein [Effusibacillus lacus]|uniref:Radical SAM/SPASM domain-containing protein n=1 Tax=Effusibacillus lacus TaxID=1348429 RepID=A0A292YR39_9BACL|nr:radical SAM protein [Effusibacillus lacus]TCS76892.1 uncharacterized protein EDD64_101116 [Effusibacillus lacus]GAX91223.1 radical SAM/SPASM domain-containing protein [Effusibacillus lacus]